MLPIHRETTNNLRALFPFIVDGNLGERGIYIGNDSHNERFFADSWEWYKKDIIGSPNWLLVGDLGSRKSSLVKTFLWRSSVYGRWGMVLDVKGEYARLACAMGTEPIFLRPNGPVQVNPFTRDATKEEHEALILAVGTSASGQSFLSSEEKTALTVALDSALRDSSEPTLPMVVQHILWPDENAADNLGFGVTRESLADSGRAVGMELQRFCTGHLRGMFDGPTTRGIDTGAKLVVLDLSEIYNNHREALQIAMRLADGWLQAAIKRGSGHGIYVVEEAWGLLADQQIARGLQGGYKLSRRTGMQYISVLHGLSDLSAAGEAGSTTRAIAQGLVRDSGVRILYHQPRDEAEVTRRELGLPYAVANLLPYLSKSVAVWMPGDRVRLVRHQINDIELDFCNTDDRMGTEMKVSA